VSSPVESRRRISGASAGTLLERRAHALGSAYRLFYDRPVHLVRGEGVWLYDAQGGAYLDAYNNVPVVGHCHPRVVEALSGQAAILNTHTRYLHESILDYAENLLATYPAELNRVMLTGSGSESNDLALRLARHYTGAEGIIVTRHAYHGNTSVTAEISPALGPSYRRPPHVRLVDAPDTYRGHGDVAARFVQDVDEAIKDMAAHGIRPAALLVDTVFSSDGLFTDPAGFLAPAIELVQRAGALFIADEVQGGFGRCGTDMWGFQRHGVMPDLATMGKPMGNGHPMAGLVARSEIIDAFGRDCRYFNTFAGNPVSCVVGMAVLDVIRDENLMQRALQTGDALRVSLREMMARYPRMGDVRGAGLFTALELVEPGDERKPDGKLAHLIVNDMREHGVLIGSAGPGGNVLKVRPPLVFSEDDARLLCEALEASMGRCV